MLARALALLLLGGTHAFEEVHTLDARTWEKTQSGAWFILFYAPWCGHCRKLAPIFESVAEHYHRASPQRVSLGKVDATANQALSAPFELKGYPTLILLRDGKRQDFSGKRTFEGLVEFVEAALALPPGTPLPPPAPPPSTPTMHQPGSAGPAKSQSKRKRPGFVERMQQAAQGFFAAGEASGSSSMSVGFVAAALFGTMGVCLMGALAATTTAGAR